MKRDVTPLPKPSKPSRALLVTYRVAVALVLALIGALAVGSLYAFVRPPNSGPLFYLGRQGDRAGGHAGQGGGLGDWTRGERVNVFTGMGMLRVPLAGESPATVVLSISFPYPADDMAFAEELASRVGEFRSTAIAYFSSFDRDELLRLDEALARNEILSRFNALLRLGRIEELYFTDLAIL